MLELIARLLVGIGFLWLVIVLVVGLLGGFDKPSAWFKLLDDAIDITLQVVTGNAAASDNTSYSTPPHHPLLTTFPYLAAPN